MGTWAGVYKHVRWHGNALLRIPCILTVSFSLHLLQGQASDAADQILHKTNSALASTLPPTSVSPLRSTLEADIGNGTLAEDMTSDTAALSGTLFTPGKQAPGYHKYS